MIVRGDVAGCEALARTLHRTADGVGSAAAHLGTARAATPSWEGDAADGWRELAGRQRAAADDLAAVLAGAGRAVSRFAADLAEAQHLARRAEELAASACLSLSSSGTVPPVEVPHGPYETEQDADDAAAARRRAETRADVLSLVARAREAERRAHETLLTGLRGLAPGARACTPSSGARPGSGFTLVPEWDDLVMAAHDLLLASRTIADGQSALAAAHGAFARQVRTAATGASGAEAAALRRLRNAELREMRHWRGSAATWAARADDVDRLVPWARYADRPVAAAVPVLRSLPIVGLVTTGAGVALDVSTGTDAGTAVASNVASAGAAALAAPVLTAGAAALLGTATVAAAPVVIGVVGAAFIGVGVGNAVEAWGDDVVDAVGDAAGGAKDLAGKAWNAVFG